MKKIYLLCLSVLLITLVGCFGGAKIDTTSSESFNTSLKAINDSLSEAEAQEFFNYLFVVVEGKAGSLTSENRKQMTYEDASEIHAALQLFGNENDKAEFQKLNGLTAEDIIAQGKEIVKKAVKERLTELDAELKEQETLISELEKIKVAQKQIVVEITNPVEVIESDQSNGKGKIASFVASIVIKNDSALPLYGFLNGNLELLTEEGKRVSIYSELGKFVGKDGRNSLKRTYGFFSSNEDKEPAVLPGEILEGTVTFNLTFLSDKYVYPPTQKYTVKLASPEEISPQFEKSEKISSYASIQKRIEWIKETIITLNTKLAGL